jgi:hypothetical protein
VERDQLELREERELSVRQEQPVQREQPAVAGRRGQREEREREAAAEVQDQQV